MPNNLLSIDHLIVYAFLLLTLGLGIYSGRGITTVRNYGLCSEGYKYVHF